MIKSWQIANFKSFSHPKPIDMASVNVLAGANSSGKSSIIQIILLLKQTLQYGAQNRPLTLNGPLIRLGSFEDIRNFDAGAEDVEIGFCLEFEKSELQGRRVSP